MIYILGAGHSGSTLVDLLLGSQAEITSLGEMVNFDQVVEGNKVCTCGNSVRECQYWSKVIDKSHTNGALISDTRGQSLAFPLNLYHYFISFLILKLPLRIPIKTLAFIGRYLLERGNSILSILNEVHNCRRSNYYVDSSKSAIRLYLIYQLAAFPVKVIYLTRDGRAVSASTTKRKNAKEKSIKRLAKDWLEANQQSLSVLRYIEDKDIFHLRYEELCRDTDKVLGTLSEFLELKSELQISKVLEANEVHTFAGNPIRFKKSREFKEDLKWRHRLSKEDVNQFENVAGRLNRKLLGKYYEE